MINGCHEHQYDDEYSDLSSSKANEEHWTKYLVSH